MDILFKALSSYYSRKAFRDHTHVKKTRNFWFNNGGINTDVGIRNTQN